MGELISRERKDENYCKDCDRSIYGEFPSCDVNIENNGKYVMADDKCYCKITNGKRAELYPWEGGEVSRTCDNCKHYHWYYDRCDLYDSEVDARSVCATWETRYGTDK